MLEKLSSKEITDIILAILMAHHMHELNRISAMLSDFPHENRWHELWNGYKAAAEDEETALVWFTKYIQSQLDGGDWSQPPTFNNL